MAIELARARTHSSPSGRSFASPSKLLFDSDAAREKRRRRIWEISSHLHCSIIGTCLSTTELRQIFIKLRVAGIHKETDHELHVRAMLIAGKRELASKLLQKALDRRHRSVITQFSRAQDAEELAALWSNALQRAEIAGGYWAVLSHPLSTEGLVRQVFGEVHMLSHLVGAANRADIRRLRELENEKAALLEKVARQQSQLRDALVKRDATIAGLNEMLGKAIASAQNLTRITIEPSDRIAQQPTAQLIAALRRRLQAEVGSRDKIQRRLETVTAERDAERRQRRISEERERDLRQELESVELTLSTQFPVREGDEEQGVAFRQAIVLYVGGRAHQIPQLRALVERSGASFLHHDGGIEDRSGILEAQVSRADVVFFPADCVSHNAVATLKRVARYLGKPYVALRSSGLSSLAAALRKIAIQQQVGSERMARPGMEIVEQP
jgi:Uncharacterized protein conserved in bacteria (DUF2325)